MRDFSAIVSSCFFFCRIKNDLRKKWTDHRYGLNSHEVMDSNSATDSLGHVWFRLSAGVDSLCSPRNWRIL